QVCTRRVSQVFWTPWTPARRGRAASPHKWECKHRWCRVWKSGTLDQTQGCLLWRLPSCEASKENHTTCERLTPACTKPLKPGQAAGHPSGGVQHHPNSHHTTHGKVEQAADAARSANATAVWAPCMPYGP